MSIQRVKYDTVTNCEGILQAILENPKAGHAKYTFSQICNFLTTKSVLLTNDLYL